MSQPENTQQHEDDDDPSSQLESLAIREQQPSDAPTTGEERALEAEERVFDISLLRRKILRYKMK